MKTSSFTAILRHFYNFHAWFAGEQGIQDSHALQRDVHSHGEDQKAVQAAGLLHRSHVAGADLRECDTHGVRRNDHCSRDKVVQCTWTDAEYLDATSSELRAYDSAISTHMGAPSGEGWFQV
nr:uncharacterized protein LOC129387409 isoform X2 [Dermacentor andersoni]